MAEHLRVGLAGNPTDAGLSVHYQPLVQVSDHRVVGAEALVRWQHPTLGLLLPSQFLPIAEDAGLDVALAAWVLRTSLRAGRLGRRPARRAAHDLGEPLGLTPGGSRPRCR